ncbi:MAG: dephospho-CoA kinase [Pricia sp.]|nr:dephospho-CoA kinase [Pricia sp.]
MFIVGLTGGIGSGKTTVGKFFAELGVPVYNSDEEAKRLMADSEEVKMAITDLLGNEAYEGDKLNKKYISERVFTNKGLLKSLNAIVHPAVRKHFLSWAKRQDSVYVIQEAAIIFEIGSQNFYDKIILVTAPKNLRIDRILNRDEKESKSGVETRMANQWDDTKKITASHYVIENLDRSKTRDRVLEVHHALLANS